MLRRLCRNWRKATNADPVFGAVGIPRVLGTYTGDLIKSTARRGTARAASTLKSASSRGGRIVSMEFAWSSSALAMPCEAQTPPS